MAPSKNDKFSRGGLRFAALLDIRDKEPEETAHGPSVEAACRSPRALRVLVAEDDAVNREFVATILRKAGHRCGMVDNGAKAVTAVQDGAYDIVLMDLHMPGVDGIEATRRIRGLGGAVSGIPIIALTADFVAGQQESFDTVGMDGYIIKPFDPKMLLSTIDRAVCK